MLGAIGSGNSGFQSETKHVISRPFEVRNVNDLTQYASLLGEIKTRIGQAQTKAALSVNREMLALYWDIGRLITKRQTAEGWGAGVLRKLALDLKNELPGVKGFSATIEEIEGAVGDGNE